MACATPGVNGNAEPFFDWPGCFVASRVPLAAPIHQLRSLFQFRRIRFGELPGHLDVFLQQVNRAARDRKSTRLNSSHTVISYAVFCFKKKICEKSLER